MTFSLYSPPHYKTMDEYYKHHPMNSSMWMILEREYEIKQERLAPLIAALKSRIYALGEDERKKKAKDKKKKKKEKETVIMAEAEKAPSDHEEIKSKRKTRSYRRRY